MTESEWEECVDSEPMLRFVRGKVSDRKLRLFAAASFRRLADLLPDPRQRRGIDVLERLADGTIAPDEYRGVAADLRRALPPDNDERPPGSPPVDSPYYVALMLYREHRSKSIAVHAVHAARGAADAAGELREQARLMRCVCGNPFRPTAVAPRWCSPVAVALAQAIYEGRDFDRLPALADALEDAGCEHAELLAHCRSRTPHARGCWATDLVFGRG